MSERRSAVWPVYAVIATMCATAAAVAWMSLQEVRMLSQPHTAQSVWHVYQTQEAVQRVAAAAQAVGDGSAGEERLRVELELLAAQTAAVREFRILDLQLPEYARAWRAIEQRTSEGLAAIDRPAALEADAARSLAEQFGALRDTARFLLLAAHHEQSRTRDAFRARLIERFWLGVGAMTVLIAGLLYLLRRAHAGEARQRAQAGSLLDLNRTLEARVLERTREIEADRTLRTQILEASPSAIALLRVRDQMPLYFNARLRQLLGLDATPGEAFPPQRLFADAATAQQFAEQVAGSGALRDWEALVAGTPQPFPALISARHVDVGGERALLVWLHDHSQRKRLENELQRLATTDPLTALANRRAFFERGQPALEAARRYSHAVSMLMIDVDHFKNINDHYGHATGDAMLRLLADRMREVLRQADLIARIGGEEFVALLPQTDVEAATQAAERLRERCDGLAPDAPAAAAISISVGVAQWRAGESLDHLLERADAALYRAKRAGRNRVEAS